jgi:hypothetical protein
MNLGYLVNQSLSPSESVVCDCPGARALEMLDEPPVMDKFWHVCPCCGTRSLLSLIQEDSQ